MARRKKTSPTAADLPVILEGKLRPPLGVVLGSPREVADLVASLGFPGITCYQMDLFQATRLREELAERGLEANVVTAPDLWDLPADFQTLVYPIPQGGERGLKLDMVEQAYHTLRQRGNLVVVSPYEKEQLFPAALKKIFGRVHAPAAGEGVVFWSQRDGERPRRRHEVSFRVSQGEGKSLNFLSRPGVFAYGRFDEGGRALTETMDVRPGDRVLDVGCGCGTNGTLAGLRCGPEGNVVFVDSNVRATALAGLNASANGLTQYEVIASSTVEGVAEGEIDVAIANPPYHAQMSIALLFIERCRQILRPGGRFYLVTKVPDTVGPMVAEHFGTTEVVARRGYVVLCAEAPQPAQGKNGRARR